MDNSAGPKQIIKEFLIWQVRDLSRLFANKNNGQEKIWDDVPPNWPDNMAWKNPTSTPKDNIEQLEKKYNFLYRANPEKLSESNIKAYSDFNSHNINRIQGCMKCDEWKKQITNMIRVLEIKNWSSSESLDPDFKDIVKKLYTKITSLTPKSSPQKRRNENPVEVSHKKKKTQDPKVKVITNERKQCHSAAHRHILPKLSQAALSTHCTDQVTNMPLLGSLGVDIPPNNPIVNKDLLQSLAHYSKSVNSNDNSSVKFVTLSPLLMHPKSKSNDDSSPQFMSLSPSLRYAVFNSNEGSSVQSVTLSPSLMHPTFNYEEGSSVQSVTLSPSLMHPTFNYEDGSSVQSVTLSPSLMHPTFNYEEGSSVQSVMPNSPLVPPTFNNNPQNNNTENSTKMLNKNILSIDSGISSVENNNTNNFNFDITNLSKEDDELLNFLGNITEIQDSFDPKMFINFLEESS